MRYKSKIALEVTIYSEDMLNDDEIEFIVNDYLHPVTKKEIDLNIKGVMHPVTVIPTKVIVKL